PVVSSLRGWNDQAAIGAPAPAGPPRYVEPAAQAASSSTGISPARSRSAATSAGTPPWCTASTALVRPVRTGPTVAGDKLPVNGSTSANTGVAPVYRTALAVAMNENDGTTTSSPGRRPSTCSMRWRPVVQDDTA